MRTFILILSIFLITCSSGKYEKNNDYTSQNDLYNITNVRPSINYNTIKSTLDSVIFEYEFLESDSSFCNRDDNIPLRIRLINESNTDKYYLMFSCDNGSILMSGNPNINVFDCILCNMSYPLCVRLKGDSKDELTLYLEKFTQKGISLNFVFYPLSKHDFENENFKTEFKFQHPNSLEPFLIKGTEIKD